MASKKGKKNKGKTLALSDFLQVTPGTVPAMPLRKSTSNWADEVEDNHDIYDARATKSVVLPTAPKASRDFDDIIDKVPMDPPYIAYLSNLPYDVDENEIEYFFKNMKISNMRIPKDDRPGEQPRLKGYGYVEFEDRDSLLNALLIPDTTIKNRRVRIEIASDNDDKRRNNRSDMNRDRGQRSDISPGDWRSGPRTEAVDSNNDRRGGGGFSRDRDRGFTRSTGDRYNKDRDEEFSRSRGGMTRDNEREDRGEITRAKMRDPQDADKDTGFSRSRDNDFSRSRGGESDFSRNRGGESDFSRSRDGDSDFSRSRGGDNDFSRSRGGDSDFSRSRGGDSDFSRSRGGDSDFSRSRDKDRDDKYGPRRYDDKNRSGGGGFIRREDPPEKESSEPRQRPKLVLAPRTKPVEEPVEPATTASIFGNAKPVDTAGRLREIEERLKKTEIAPAAPERDTSKERREIQREGRDRPRERERKERERGHDHDKQSRERTPTRPQKTETNGVIERSHQSRKNGEEKREPKVESNEKHKENKKREEKKERTEKEMPKLKKQEPPNFVASNKFASLLADEEDNSD